MVYNNLYVFLYWPFHFIIFILIASLVRGYYARRYKGYDKGLDRNKVKVSVIIPEYNEDLDIFEKCLKSVVENKPDEIIVVYDDNRKEIEKIAKKYGAKAFNVVGLGAKERIGKRGALALGWLMATGDIIVQIDSDTILRPNSIEELIKPFSDPKVAGVQGHPLLFKTKDTLPYLLGQLIEISRDVVCRMLDGMLVVIDGKIAAYRREFVVNVSKSFITEKYKGKKVMSADDRYLTFLANINGYKTVYQSSAIAFSAAQPTFTRFVYQQIRWLRSAYFYLIKDLKSGLFFMSTRRYRFQLITYLFAPISFTFSLINTLFLNPPIAEAYSIMLGDFIGHSSLLPIIISILIFGIGIVLTVRLGLILMNADIRILGLSPLQWFVISVMGLIVFYPISLYSMFTYASSIGEIRKRMLMT
jgi:cellulose synthase/poly-beta-1,6-N-acetylglucosamine synthase-like glycosyltransferase